VRIALVILHADPARGGAERYTLDLAAALRARGHHVSLIASSFAPKQQTPDDVQLKVGRGTRLSRYVYFLDALDRHLAETKYDIVHAMLPVRHCDIYHPHAGIAAESVSRGHLKHESAWRRSAAKLANSVNMKRRKFAAVERALLTGAKPPIVLSLSEYVKKNVLEFYALPPDRLATLFNAVDLKKFDPDARPEARTQIRDRFGISSDHIVALMIAQDFPRKGLRETILAMPKVNDPRLVLLVVGKQNPARYRQLAEEMGIAERVIFAGSTDDPFSFYKASDFFVLPTRHDPCSLVVLEALAMGLPVISTIFNGACEIMKSGTHGFVLDEPGDVPSTVSALKTLCDPHRRAEMSAAAFTLRPRLAYEHHVEELMRIYERAQKDVR